MSFSRRAKPAAFSVNPDPNAMFAPMLDASIAEAGRSIQEGWSPRVAQLTSLEI